MSRKTTLETQDAKAAYEAYEAAEVAELVVEPVISTLPCDYCKTVVTVAELTGVHNLVACASCAETAAKCENVDVLATLPYLFNPTIEIVGVRAKDAQGKDVTETVKDADGADVIRFVIIPTIKVNGSAVTVTTADQRTDITLRLHTPAVENKDFTAEVEDTASKAVKAMFDALSADVRECLDTAKWQAGRLTNARETAIADCRKASAVAHVNATVAPALQTTVKEAFATICRGYGIADNLVNVSIGVSIPGIKVSKAAPLPSPTADHDAEDRAAYATILAKLGLAADTTLAAFKAHCQRVGIAFTKRAADIGLRAAVSNAAVRKAAGLN